MEISRVSKASAKQRAGRAGRTGAGRVLRLYSQMDFQQRAEHDTAEMARMDLAQLCLSLRAMGIANPTELDWLDEPPAQAVEQAEDLLDRLGADEAMARQLMRYPLHPRLARMLVAALDHGAGDAGCATAALLGSGVRVEQNDLLEVLDHLAGAGHDERFQMQLRQMKNLTRADRHKQASHDDDALLQAVLAGFPDRVARRRAGKQVLLASGGSAEFAGEPPSYPLMVALEIEDRTENALPLIRLSARVEPEWLLDRFPEHMREETQVVWNRQAERVDALNRLYYDALILEESNHARPEAQAAAALLAEKALEAGIERFVETEMLEQWLGRLEFAGFAAPDLHELLTALCQELRSFAELKNAAKDFFSFAEQHLDAHRLRELAPLTLKLAAGRQVKIHYERGQEPWIESRLQDFFGMTETPRIGPHRAPVVLHLLAPNHRAVQITSDLSGFWQRHYPQVRRELMRRYPRHSWPEQVGS